MDTIGGVMGFRKASKIIRELAAIRNAGGRSAAISSDDTCGSCVERRLVSAQVLLKRGAIDGAHIAAPFFTKF